MINEIEKELDIIKETLISKLEPQAIILFGSFARNCASNESDVDIAFISKQHDKKTIFEIKTQLQEQIMRDIDLVNIEDYDIYDSFKYEVLMNGIVLYTTDSYQFDLYKIKILKDFLELNEGRNDIIERVKNGGTIYGK